MESKGTEESSYIWVHNRYIAVLSRVAPDSRIPLDDKQSKYNNQENKKMEEEIKSTRIDNGNSYIFCDKVHDGQGCIRGAGHNGPCVVLQNTDKDLTPKAPVYLIYKP